MESDFRERLLRAEAAHLAALTCNKLILATAAVFAGIALLLSGLLGFLLGRLAQKEEVQLSFACCTSLQPSSRASDASSRLRQSFCCELAYIPPDSPGS